jgi:hypothetical protein
MQRAGAPTPTRPHPPVSTYRTDTLLVTSVRNTSPTGEARQATTPPTTVAEARERHRAALAAGRARRAATTSPRPRTGSQAPATHAPTDRRLGPTGETTDTQVTGGYSTPSASNPDQHAGSEESRDGRHQLREALGDVTNDDALSKCGKFALAGGVTPKVTPNGRAYLSGVGTCGKVHFCPVCQATIRTARSAELQAAGTAWETYGGRHQDALTEARAAKARVTAAIEAGESPDWMDLVAEARADGLQGGGLAMLTLTMRHYARHDLSDLVDQQRDAWKLSLGQNAGRAWRAAKKRFGVAGFVRAWECTHGANHGWHPHWHVLVFFEEPLTPDEGTALEDVIYEAWSSALTKVGAYLPDREHGVRLDLSGHGEGGALARYLMKYQDGKTGWSTAAEMTRQDVKAGRDGHRTPLEIARTFLGDGQDEAYERDRDLWHEYENGAAGLRSLYWSNGLRARLAPLVDLEERTDAELAVAEDGQATPVAVVLADPWHRHIGLRKGRSLALLKAVERDGITAMRSLVESWGLVWGVDVTEPPTITAAGKAEPTAAELLADNERADMAARAEVWRREFDRQDREERLSRVEFMPDAWDARRRQTDRLHALADGDDARAAAHAHFKRRLREAKALAGAS